MNKPVLTYYNIAPDVTAFSTTRHGGSSKGNYGEFNINTYCGDNPDAIAGNRMALEQELGVSDDRLIMPHQVHLTRNRVVDPLVLSLSQRARSPLLEAVDSLTTDIPNVCIGVSTADCMPILLYDKSHHAAAAVHAGWRGTERRIVIHTVDSMSKVYATRSEDIVAVIGPGISLKNFEVGQDVYDSFANNGFDMSRISARFPSFTNKEILKWHIDLPLCNKLQLMKTGVREESIIMTNICTYDNVADYFSARRLGQASGRIYTAIILR